MNLTEEGVDTCQEPPEPEPSLRELSDEELTCASGGKRCIFQWIEGDVVAG